MKYHVTWPPHVVDSLQRIYDASGDKEGLANTITRIGLELGSNPARAGESRDHGRRILFKFPLVIWFQMNERLKEVVIVKVGTTRR